MISVGKSYMVEMITRKKRGGFFIPEGVSKEDEVIARIINVGLIADDPELHIGDIVVIERHGSSTTLKHDGSNVTVVPHYQVLALVEGGDYDSDEYVTKKNFFKSETSKVKYFDIPEHNLSHVTGLKLGLVPEKTNHVDILGGIIVPKYMEEHQIVKTNKAIVAKITKEAEKLTGITVGMKVIYDYYSVFSHDTKCHITNAENILAVIDENDEKGEE